MPSQSWVQTLATQQAAGTAMNTYTTAKSIINAQALWTVPAGFFSWVGQKIKIRAACALSNIVTTPGTITFQIQMGPTANIVAFTSGAVQLNATAHTLLPMKLEVDLTVRSIGSGTAATFMGTGTLAGIQFTLTAGQVDAVNTSGLFQIPVTAPAVGTGWDSTVANILDFWAGFSISNGGNGITVHDYEVVSCN